LIGNDMGQKTTTFEGGILDDSLAFVAPWSIKSLAFATVQFCEIESMICPGERT
jgi:hypothetical protein